MKYWATGILLAILGYSGLVTTRVSSHDPEDVLSAMRLPIVGNFLEQRYYGYQKKIADAGNVQSMLQMYLLYSGVGQTGKAREYEKMLRSAAAGGSSVAQMQVDIFIDHQRRHRTTRQELVFGLGLMKEKDQHPEYRDMWSNHKSADDFASFLSFVARGDADALDVWDNEPELWSNWNWSHSEWLRGVNLAGAYPALAARDSN